MCFDIGEKGNNFVPAKYVCWKIIVKSIYPKFKKKNLFIILENNK